MGEVVKAYTIVLERISTGGNGTFDADDPSQRSRRTRLCRGLP